MKKGMKGGVTRRSRSTTRSRSRSRTPELMRPWIQRLQVGQRYRFQTRDNRAPITGIYDGREGRNFIFTVDGHRTRFPIYLINPTQTRATRPGLDDAFVVVNNGGNRLPRNRNTRKLYR